MNIKQFLHKLLFGLKVDTSRPKKLSKSEKDQIKRIQKINGDIYFNNVRNE